MPAEIGWDEALDLVRILLGDPSSQLAAAAEGWDHPLDRVGWMMADLLDVQGKSKFGKKWDPYPRPLKAADTNTKRRGNAAGRTPEEVKAILRSQFGQSSSAPA